MAGSRYSRTMRPHSLKTVSDRAAETTTLVSNAAGHQSDQRHDDVVDKGIDDLSERPTDDDADGKIHHAALHRKLFELRDHAHRVLQRYG